MSTDDPRTLLHDAATGPVAPLDHEELRRRARNRTRSRWSAVAVAGLAVAAGIGTLVATPTAPPSVDIMEAPGGPVAPPDPPSGVPELPVTLDLPEPGAVAAVHVGDRPGFVVHHRDGDVLVLDAISPHHSTDLPKVVAYCRDAWTFESRDGQAVIDTPGSFADLWHGSRFALDGTWLGGPAPTGLPRYEVQSRDGDTVTVGPLGAAPGREVGPFEDVLGPRGGSSGRSVEAASSPCTERFDQTRRDASPADPAAVVWHEPHHPARWLYPFGAADDQATAPGYVGPLAEGERAAPQQSQGAQPFGAVLVILGFVAAVAVISRHLRRRDADGSLDAGPSSVSRPGLRRLFDFGPRGWSRDGTNQPPED